MYEYSEESNPLSARCWPHNVEQKLDTLPLIHPYAPRLCKQQGHFLIWYGPKEDNLDVYDECLKAKTEPQWVSCDSTDRVDLAVALVYPFDDEIIIGTVKYAGYIKSRSKSARTKLIKTVWADLIKMFGDRRIICPSGTYFDYLHLSINQKRAPHEAYHKRIMLSNGFEKHEEFWIRERENLLA